MTEDRLRSRLLIRSASVSEQSWKIRVQTAGLAEEIERTRRICAHSLELLRLPIPSTFLGNKFEPLQSDDEK